jgi:hypothetical protein
MLNDTFRLVVPNQIQGVPLSPAGDHVLFSSNCLKTQKKSKVRNEMNIRSCSCNADI